MVRPQKERPAVKERPTTKRKTAGAVNHFLLRLQYCFDLMLCENIDFNSKKFS